MTWQPPQDSFVIEPKTHWVDDDKAWRNDEGLKKLFGEALVKHATAFNAALEVFPNETNKALWASWNWLTDPLVVASRQDYAQNVELNSKLLDKEALAARLLKFAEEKDHTGRFYICEAKDRLAAYKLFAEVQGFIGKVNIDASTTNFTNNELKITLVKPTKKEEKAATVIENEPEIQNKLPVNLKLVAASR
jgi:hypothetical protein